MATVLIDEHAYQESEEELRGEPHPVVTVALKSWQHLWTQSAAVPRRLQLRSLRQALSHMLPSRVRITRRNSA
jgi:hypothetical protein